MRKPYDEGEAMPIFAKQTSKKGERHNAPTTTNNQMIKTPPMLAKQIELGMHRASKECNHYQNAHCALYENDLAQICPRKDKDRKKKLVKFAEQYGFRLRFYREGLFAIFGRRTPPHP
jgi:hypothetical protein